MTSCLSLMPFSTLQNTLSKIQTRSFIFFNCFNCVLFLWEWTASFWQGPQGFRDWALACWGFHSFTSPKSGLSQTVSSAINPVFRHSLRISLSAPHYASVWLTPAYLLGHSLLFRSWYWRLNCQIQSMCQLQHSSKTWKCLSHQQTYQKSVFPILWCILENVRLKMSLNDMYKGGISVTEPLLYTPQ